MGKTTVIVSSALKKKLKDTALKVRQDFAKEATKQITEGAQEAIQAFYDHYEPLSYRRTYGFLNKSYKSAYKNPGHGTIRGGVRITAEGNKNKYIYFEETNEGFKTHTVERSYEATGEWHISSSDPVANQAKTIGQMTDLLYSGRHGYTEIFEYMRSKRMNNSNQKNNKSIAKPPIMKPSPYDRIKKKREEFVKEFCNDQNATEFAKKYW